MKRASNPECLRSFRSPPLRWYQNDFTSSNNWKYRPIMTHSHLFGGIIPSYSSWFFNGWTLPLFESFYNNFIRTDRCGMSTAALRSDLKKNHASLGGVMYDIVHHSRGFNPVCLSRPVLSHMGNSPQILNFNLVT